MNEDHGDDRGASAAAKAGDEAVPEQLGVARQQGKAHGSALEAMAAGNGIRIQRVGDYVVAFTTDKADSVYALWDETFRWVEQPRNANTHLVVAVTDSGNGRFMPQLDVTVTVIADEGHVFTGAVPFLWHPFLHH